MQPLVSVIIPVYNGANYMREAIDSALAQTYKNIEIVVINDGSTDNTREIALSYGDKIRYFEKENGGVSTALNLGIRQMRGEYFSWLSHDDIYYPDKIQEEIDALLHGGNMMRVVYSDWDSLFMSKGEVKRAYNAKRLASYGKNVIETGALTPALGLISGCTLLIPKQYFSQYGMFDESLRAVQDYKKWFEMFRGKRMLYVSKVLVQSRVHPLQVTYTYEGRTEEADMLYSWIVGEMTEDDLEGSGISMYHFYGTMISKLRNGEAHVENELARKKLLSIDEPRDSEIQRNSFSKRLCNDRKKRLYLYCAGRRSRALILALTLRGISIDGITDSNVKNCENGILGVPVVSSKNIPKGAVIIVTKANPEDVEEMLRSNGYENVISYDEIMGDILKTPVKKELVSNLDFEKMGNGGI